MARLPFCVIAIGLLPVLPAQASELPGRVGAISVGASLQPLLGRKEAPSPPTILRSAPEIQISWGLRLGDQVLLLTRLELLGGISPPLPSGVGAELAVAWVPMLGRGWSPQLRAGGGAIALVSGGQELGIGPDYSAFGFRLGVECGLMHRTAARAPLVFSWSVLAGIQALGLPSVEPCREPSACSDASLGPSLRIEGLWLF